MSYFKKKYVKKFKKDKYVKCRTALEKSCNTDD